MTAFSEPQMCLLKQIRCQILSLKLHISKLEDLTTSLAGGMEAERSEEKLVPVKTKTVAPSDLKPTKLTVRQAVEKYPFLTESSLRWMLFNRDTNGLKIAVLKIGKRLLIDDNKFQEWLESHEQK